MFVKEAPESKTKQSKIDDIFASYRSHLLAYPHHVSFYQLIHIVIAQWDKYGISNIPLMM